MSGLEGMTFETPATGKAPECADHGPECIGHAMRVEVTDAQVEAAYAVLTPYVGCGCCAEKEWPEQPDGQDALKVLLREALEAAAEVTG